MLSPSSTALEVVLQLASEPAVVAYFAFIGLSLRHILRASRSWPPLALAGAIVVVTWFYIGRYTVEYERSGKTNLFNDAYADVSTPSAWLLSSQLLTWVVVATIWTRDASFSYMLFGMLGAMSAAFVPWVALLDGRPNATTPPRTARPSAASQAVPISYALCALVSLVSVSALPRTLSESGESTLGFGLWLKLLHLALLAPRAVPLLLRHETSVDAFALYALLALALGGWHLSQLPSGGIFPLPVTDCQVSISCDLLCCAALSCYAIWRRTKSQCALALAVPLCAFASPGFVLAAWQACEHWPRVHTRVVRAMQATVAARLSGGAGEAHGKTTARWMNLGLWDGGEEPEEDEAAAGKGGGKGGGSPLGGYETACERLAALLGDAASIDGTDGVLVCGCGSGAELALYASRFSPFHMTGIDAHEPNATAFVRRHNLRLLHMDVEAFGDELAPQLDESVARPPLWTPRLPIGLYTKILALDNAYHYADKERWLADSAALLRAGGTVAFTDVCLRRPAAETPLWVRALLAAANIPLRNHWGADEYQTRLGELGYTAVSCESIGDAVLPKWISSSLIKWVDYVLVVGTLPRPSTPTARPTVAVVGAGLSGLTAAHLLSPTHNVTVFESLDKPGLTGTPTVLEGVTVDIPLRLVGRGYYKQVASLATGACLSFVEARADCCWYGASAPAGAASVCYHRSRLANLWEVASVGRIAEAARFAWRVARGGTAANATLEAHETWGEYLVRQGYGEQPFDGLEGKRAGAGEAGAGGAGAGGRERGSEPPPRADRSHSGLSAASSDGCSRALTSRSSRAPRQSSSSSRARSTSGRRRCSSHRSILCALAPPSTPSNLAWPMARRWSSANR